MVWRRLVLGGLALGVAITPVLGAGQDEPGHRRGRKYKAPPETSHLEIEVLKEFNGKPILNAAVVFHPVKDGKDEGNLEVKTNGDGKAIIDVIPTGSTVRVQVIANGFATFAEEYLVSEASREIVVKMRRPQAQVSVYEDTDGKPSERKFGVQEPPRIHVKAVEKPSAPAGAAVKGLVKDQTGAPVYTASITIKEMSGPRGVTVLHAGTDGSYKQTQLPPGRYRVEVKAQGFRTETHEDVVLRDGEEHVFNDRLEVGTGGGVQVEESVQPLAAPKP